MNGDWPRKILVMVTTDVSTIGSSNIKAGTPIIANTLEACGSRAIASAATEKPKNKLPLSPMKIDAGGKLKTRNPNVEPTITKEIIRNI